MLQLKVTSMLGILSATIRRYFDSVVRTAVSWQVFAVLRSAIELIGDCKFWRCWLRRGGIGFLLVVAGCGSTQDFEQSSRKETDAIDVAKEVWLIDGTAEAKIDFVHQRGPTRYWLPEIMGGGAVWFDYDNDNDPDLYLVQGGDLAHRSDAVTNILYRNNGDGTFDDVTYQASVGDNRYGMGATAGDYDGDGDLDLYVTNVGSNVLYRNLGDGRFEDVSRAAGVDHDGWGTACCFVDYDQDSHLDLFVVNYIRWSHDNELDCRTNDNLRDYCAPTTYQAPAPDILYRNNGDGSFSDVTLASGMATAYGNGLGAVAEDFNSDGRLDFYVANDGTPNQLWIQDSAGRFRDESLLMGCAVNGFGAAEAGMGVAAFDLENDGDLDLLMTHLGKETNTLYVNQGRYFEDRSAAAKLAAPSFANTGFGLAVVDLDHDGYLDVYVANGRVGRNQQPLDASDVFAEPNQLFRGVGNGHFEEVPAVQIGYSEVATSRAVATADFDLDGDVDLCVVNNNGDARLLVNQIGNGRPSYQLRLKDEHDRDAIGAKVGVDDGETTQWRTVTATTGYLSGSDPKVHVGLTSSHGHVKQVHIVWPNGRRETRDPSH